jgi:hypothetical protein
MTVFRSVWRTFAFGEERDRFADGVLHHPQVRGSDADAEVGIVDVTDEPFHLGECVNAFVPALVFVGTGFEIGGER